MGMCSASSMPPNGQLLLAVALCTFGCALLTAGICIPPAGVIDSSVLVAFGEILTFAGSLVGIDYHYRYRRPPLTPPSEGEDAE